METRGLLVRKYLEIPLKTKDELTKTDWRLTTYWGGEFSNPNGYLERNLVIPGALIRGNHHDPNPWSYFALHARFLRGYYKTYYPTWGNVFDYGRGNYPGQGVPWYPRWDDFRSIVYNRALERLNVKVRGDLDLGVSLAEFGQTRRMIAALGKLPSHDRVWGWLNGQEFANAWLQWQYGWRPALSDLYGALNEGVTIVLAQLRKVSASARLQLGGPGSILPGNLLFERYLDSVCEGKGVVGCRINLEYQVNGSSLDRWSSLNPVSLGYELMPYSFVLDWFYDVGSWLRATETAVLYNSTFRSGFVSEWIKYDGTESPVQTVFDDPYGNPPTRTEIFVNPASIKYRSFNRSILTSYPFPHAPTFKVDLGATRIASAAALLRQLIKR